MLYSFGWLEHLDVDALRRLVKSISRFLDPQDATQARAASERKPATLEFIESRPMGHGFLKTWRPGDPHGGRRRHTEESYGSNRVLGVGTLGIWRRTMGIEPTERSLSTRPDRF